MICVVRDFFGVVENFKRLINSLELYKMGRFLFCNFYSFFNNIRIFKEVMEKLFDRCKYVILIM